MRYKDKCFEKCLSKDERELICKTKGLSDKDCKTLLKVKRIICTSYWLVKRFDSCRPINFQHYMAEQWAWTTTEEWIVGQKVDCTLSEDKKKKVKSKMFIEDFSRNKNGIRFKIFYCLKYPNRVTWD